MSYPQPVMNQPGMPPIGFAQPGMPPGYPPYPQPGGGGYPPPGGQGYPPPGGQGYPPPAGHGYPPPGAPPMGYPQPGPGPVTGPPMSGHMNGIPPGLQYLTQVDQLLVKQKVELLEAFVGFETANKYSIKNSLGQKIYYAAEDNDCCTRNCCGPLRPFEMKILDNNKQEVMHFSRPFRCDSCWFPCCLQEMEVMAGPGNVIGTIRQEWSIFVPKFTIHDQSGEVVLRIEGPFCTFGVCGDVEFQVLSRDGAVQVGKISKQWSGLLREAFTDADYFGVTFPIDLDVKVKATLLAACFLIDYMFFEKKGNKENDGIGMF